MAWWDTVHYEELENWIPTLWRTPRDVHHGLALFRGAVCRDIRRAREAGDAVAESRACKLLTFMDRLVLTATRGTRGCRKHKGTLSSTITARLRLAWKGDWGSLWRDAAASARDSSRAAARGKTPAEDARSVSSLVRDGLLSKALAVVLRQSAVLVGPDVHAALVDLFPPGALPEGLPAPPPMAPETRADLVDAVRRNLKRYPARSGPGPNGSRFEHWATAAADSEATDHVSQVAVMFLLGECPADFLQANLGARLVALRKPNGKIRPVAWGSVLRRIAARAACHVFRE